MRVMYYSPCWPPKTCQNGIATYIGNVVMSESRPFDFSVMTYESQSSDGFLIDLSKFNTPRDIFTKIQTRLFPPVFSIRGKANRDAARALSSLNGNIDLIEVEESFGLLYSGNRNRFPPISRRLHGPWFILKPLLGGNLSFNDRYRISVEGRAIQHSSGVTSPSRHVLNSVREYYGLELSHAEVIPNPVVPTIEGLRWRSSDKSDPSVLYVGRFDRLKGADILIKAFRIIALKHKDIRLSFVGPDNGLVEDGYSYSFQEYVEKYVPEAEVRARIVNHGKLLPNEIARLRRSSTVTVVASRYENFPLSLLEAMSAGCPVVATSVGGINEVITDGKNGVLVESASAESLAEGVLRIFDDVKLQNTLSTNAIEHCERTYHPSKVAKQLHQHYQRVLTRVS